MSDFVVALGLLLVIEGVLYSLFPGFAKWLCAQISAEPTDKLRLVGVLPIAAGVALVWLARG